MYFSLGFLCNVGYGQDLRTSTSLLAALRFLSRLIRLFSPNGLEQSAKCSLQDKFCMAFCVPNKKLEKTMSPEVLSGIKFLKEINFFYPSKLIVFEECKFSALLGLNDVPGT